MSGHSLEQTACEQLQAAGFFVEREVRPQTRKRATINEVDLLGWAGDRDGDLVPDVVVEVKAKLHHDIDGMLAQLSRVAAVVGARRAFLFDGEWHEADAAFTHVEKTLCPQPALIASKARAPRALIEREVWAIGDGEQRRGGQADWESVLNSAKVGARSPLGALCVTQHSRLTLARIICESVDNKHSGSEVPTALATALANMLAPSDGSVVLDPSCGLGGALWPVVENVATVSLRGWSPSDHQVRTARELAQLCEVQAEFVAASLVEILSKDTAVDAIVTSPPFNVRLGKRLTLDNGTSADFSTLLLDRIARWLKPGGRAVVVVPPRLLFEDASALLRGRLARDLRVVAVVELPAGVFQSTKIATAILVLEKRPPTKTLIAQLKHDWALQLSPKGEFFRAFLRHLERPS